MLGLKANKIERFDENILPLSISWLILTDNKLPKLPNSMGKLSKLQKFIVSGNRLEYLPDAMARCNSLELIRLSANKLKEIPFWLLELPKLSWLAFSGNPCARKPKFELDSIDYNDLEISELLGEGASGEIYKAYSKKLDSDVAIKFFKGAVTSDGYAQDEMNACMGVGEHNNLIKVIAKVEGVDKLGLILEYIPKGFINLGNPPDFDTCTRDTYDNDLEFSIKTIKSIASSIVSALKQMHEKNLMHGDIYAHNILINSEDSCYLGDFGAASFYDDATDKFQMIEIRAFGCLLEDMLLRCNEKDTQDYKSLEKLRAKCMSEDISKRVLFRDMKF